MRLKRVWVEIIVLLALTGCGKAEVQDVVMEEPKEADIRVEEPDIGKIAIEILNTPKADVQEVLPADRSEPEWEKIEGSYVESWNGYNRDLPQICPRCRISTEEEFDYYVEHFWKEYDRGLQRFHDKYSLSEYDYIIQYGGFNNVYYHHSDYIQYHDNELRFHEDVTDADSVIMSGTFMVRGDSPSGYTDIAAIPKEFFDERQLDYLYTPQELTGIGKESEGSIVVNGEQSTAGTDNVQNDQGSEKELIVGVSDDDSDMPQADKVEKEDPTANITYLDTTPSDDMEDIGEMYFKDITSEDDIIMNIEGLPIVRDQLLVTVKDSVTKTEVEALAAQYDFVIVGAIALTGDYQWESRYELSIEELDEKLNEVSTSDQVGYVSYNYTWPMDMEPEPDIL